MAGLNVNMSNSMREFIDKRSHELDFTTPTEYVRSLIREDQRQAERELFGPLLLKWLVEGRLTPEEEASLPRGLLERVQRNLEAMLLKGIESVDAGPMTRKHWDALRERVRARMSKRKKA